MKRLILICLSGVLTVLRAADPSAPSSDPALAARAPKPGDYLFISDVFHTTFLKLDEKGTEAAGATAVIMPPGGMAPKRPEPITVRVDHPFLFAVQHRRSGACLFLGRVTNPL